MPRPIEQVWCAFVRNGLQPQSRWYAWERTARVRRSDVIDTLVREGYGGMRTRADYRRLRRRGVIRVARTTLWATLPETDSATTEKTDG